MGMPVKDQNSMANNVDPDEMANNVDPDEMAHYEMSRLIISTLFAHVSGLVCRPERSNK